MTEKEILEIIKKHPEVILEIIYSSSIATKKDIKILYRKIKLNLENKAESNERMNQMENQIKLEIEKLRNESNERIEKLRAEIKIKLQVMKNSLLKWIIGLILGQTITIVLTIIITGK